MTEDDAILARHRPGNRLAELISRADAADRLQGRELLIRGRAGSWRVEIAVPGPGPCIANPQRSTLEEALIAALEIDLGVVPPADPIVGIPVVNGRLQRRHLATLRQPTPEPTPEPTVQTTMDLGD